MGTIAGAILGFVAATLLYMFLDAADVFHYGMDFFAWIAHMASAWIHNNPPGGHAPPGNGTYMPPGNGTA
jgi:hypothetical protein